MTDKIKVLFLCTGNSCRSQMAEGFARYLKGNVIDSCSAGLDDYAVRVIGESRVRDVIRDYIETLPESLP